MIPIFRQHRKFDGVVHVWGRIDDGNFTGPLPQNKVHQIDDGDIYTGLSDREGTRIFENDIVAEMAHLLPDPELARIGKVCWVDAVAKFVAVTPEGGVWEFTDEDRSFDDDCQIDNIKVVGNGWLNPQLMMLPTDEERYGEVG